MRGPAAPARGAAKTGANCTATRKPKYKFKQIVGRLARAVGPTVAAASAVARGRGRSKRFFRTQETTEHTSGSRSRAVDSSDE